MPLKKRETRRYQGALCVEEEAVILEKVRVCMKDIARLREEITRVYKNPENQTYAFALSFLKDAVQGAQDEAEEARREVHTGFYNHSHQNAWYHLFVIEEA